mgnify:CR=1 FL=1
MINNFIEEKLQKVLDTLHYDIKAKVIISNRKDLCDYQFDGAFSYAKILHQNPYDISLNIVNKFNEIYETEDDFSKIEAVRPGFINFTLSDKFINNLIVDMSKNEKFNISLPQPQKIIIDYGGPNIAKPLHVGHLRSAIVGESIKRILKYFNNEVIGDVHLGDYGLQIGQVIYGLKEKNIAKENITIELLDQIYPEMSQKCKENEEIKQKCAEITKELQDGNEEYQEYFKLIRKVSGDDILRIYNYLDVHYDLWYGESDAYPYIDKVKKDLEKRNLLVDSNGAKIVNVSKPTDEVEVPPFIFQKSNGAYLYGTTDLGTIYQRIEDFKPDNIIYVTDLRQKMHFTQLFRVCEKLGLTNHIKFEHLGFGTVNGKDGKPFKTRAGTAPKLDELFKETKEVFLKSNSKNTNMKEEDLDILVNAIIKFADLQNNREKDYIFDITKFSEVVGKTGPYILYTYLRIANILNNEEKVESNLSNVIYNNVDRNLRIKILELENTLIYSANTRLPSILANYLYELCVNLNAFYENNHINNLDDQNKKNDWLFVLRLANNIIKEMLDLLSIKIPERM